MYLFDESNKDLLPLLRMELVYDNGTMAFYPQYSQLEELILFVVKSIAKTLQSVSSLLVSVKMKQF